jgi:hypothetical protein
VSRFCGCGAQLGLHNKSGKCRPCHARSIFADPAVQERRITALAAYHATPEAKDAARVKLAHYMANMPEADRLRRAERGRELARTHLALPENRAASLAARMVPEVQARRGRALTRTRLPWCPEHLWPAYRDMTVRKGMTPAEAREALEPEIEGTLAHARRTIANITDAMRIKQERERAQAY